MTNMFHKISWFLSVQNDVKRFHKITQSRTRTHTCAHAHARTLMMCTNMHARTHAHTHTSTHTYTSTHAHRRTHTHTHIHIYICARALRTHTHTQIKRVRCVRLSVFCLTTTLTNNLLHTVLGKKFIKGSEFQNVGGHVSLALRTSWVKLGCNNGIGGFLLDSEYPIFGRVDE